MFGKNKLSKFVGNGSPELLTVQEIFYSVQGEGPSAGVPAVFIRLSGCNLQCHFCDTDFDSVNRTTSIPAILDNVFELIQKQTTRRDAQLVVITGGEPLRQNISGLVLSLLHKNFTVEIETAGTVMPDDMEDVLHRYAASERLRLICSPKTGNVNEIVERYCSHYKYVVSTDSVGIHSNTQRKEGGVKPLYFNGMWYAEATGIPIVTWVQPMAAYKEVYQWFGGKKVLPDAVKTLANQQYAAKLCLQFGFRLSIQLHKIVGLE